MSKFKLVDLTVAQVEAIEVRSEVGFDKWASPKASKAALYGSILVELGGVEPDKVGAMTMTELMVAVADVIELPGVNVKPAA